ncbi:uncharacterized protein JCM10292_007717 [Rhodotorula paludigena]|uniref:uncharacterized protein n=1 Tax=Rhodotorula paludigena TaxID=86838 RepID=UPI00317DE054
MSFFSSPAAVQKRSRDDEAEECSPGKRTKTFALAEAQRERPSDLPPPPPTPNFTTALAQQQQRELEQMMSGAMHREDIDMDMDGGEMLPSNPSHPWNAAMAPRMVHQLSNHSLSTASSMDSSMPTTPMDLPFNEQWMPNAGSSCGTARPPPQPLGHGSTSSFTDANGTTHVFSSSPPLSAYPPPLPTPSGGALAQANPMDSLAFPAHAWSAAAPASSPTKTSGVMRMDPSMGAGAGPDAHVVRELSHPTYGWDLPRQSSTLNMGAHLI